MRDFLGIELTYNILIQVFAKVKAENGISDKNEAILTEFRIREALEREDFEEVLRLKREFSVSNSRRD